MSFSRIRKRLLTASSRRHRSSPMPLPHFSRGIRVREYHDRRAAAPTGHHASHTIKHQQMPVRPRSRRHPVRTRPEYRPPSCSSGVQHPAMIGPPCRRSSTGALPESPRNFMTRPLLVENRRADLAVSPACRRRSPVASFGAEPGTRDRRRTWSASASSSACPCSAVGARPTDEWWRDFEASGRSSHASHCRDDRYRTSRCSHSVACDCSSPASNKSQLTSVRRSERLRCGQVSLRHAPTGQSGAATALVSHRHFWSGDRASAGTPSMRSRCRATAPTPLPAVSAGQQVPNRPRTHRTA